MKYLFNAFDKRDTKSKENKDILRVVDADTNKP